MVVPSFGYSVGDVFATISLIAKVITAFKRSGGACEEYQQVVRELETLQQVLQRLDSIQSNDSNFAHVNAVKSMALNCQIPLQQFLDKYTVRYGSSLGGRGKKGHGMFSGFGAAGRKIQWAVSMEKEVATLRAVVGANVRSIFLLMDIQNL